MTEAALNFDAVTTPVTTADIKAFQQRHPRGGFFASPWVMVTIVTVAAFVGLCIVAVTVAIALSARSAYEAGTAVVTPLIFVSVMAAIGIMAIVSGRRKVARSVRAERFASANGFNYVNERANPGYAGMFFQEGVDRKLRDVVTGDASGNSFETGNVSYQIGSGKNRRTITRGYIRIRLDRKLPHMVLDGTANNTGVFGVHFSNLPVDFRNNQKMSLEGDFDKHFTLYAPQGYERDALYVFTPDLMARFIDDLKVYDAEIIDDDFFAYSDQILYDDPAALQNVFGIIALTGTKTVGRTDMYRDKRASDGSGTVAAGGRRLRRGVSVLSIIIFIIILLSYVPDVIRLVAGFFGH